MIITQRKEQDIDIVEISERMVMDNVAEVQSSIKSITQDGSVKLILDLSQLVHIDSSGCSVLIWALKYIKTREGKVALCGLTSNVRALLELTRVIELFSVFASIDEALEAFAGKSTDSKKQ